jgi:hypothetical protein
MTMHYHGTPITPRAKLLELPGRNFCVSYADPRDVAVCHEIGQSVMLDNGAFSFWKTGKPVDWDGYMDWAEPWLDHHTTWAVIPDVIDGTSPRTWSYLPRGRTAVYHAARRCGTCTSGSTGSEAALFHGYERVCIGSSGQYAALGTPRWHRRMEEAFNALCPTGPPPVWLHMLRGMAMTRLDYPFASVDSTDLARNHNRGVAITKMADQWDGRQCPARWTPRHAHPELWEAV